MELKYARIIAGDLVRRLEPFTRNLLIAGSVRRHKPLVKDIEIVATPHLVQSGGDTLFEEVPVATAVSPHFINVVKGLGVVLKGEPRGRYMQINVQNMYYGKINLDLFLPEPADFWRQAVIRTGSSEWVIQHVARGWRNLGWCGSDQGLRKMSDCINEHEGKLDRQGVRLKPKWICTASAPERPPVWESELAFFEWLKIPYVDPKDRI